MKVAKSSNYVAVGIFLMLSLSASSVVHGVGLDVEYLTSTPGVSVCEPGMAYEVNMAALSGSIPGFVAPALTCGSRPVSSNLPMACEWHPNDFLKMAFQRGVELTRHGVPREDAFQIFKHARGVLWNYQICNPYRNNATRVTIPLALEILYGVLVAQFQAKYASAFSMPVSSLSSSLQTAVYDLESVSTDYPLNLNLPEQILPGQALFMTSASAGTTVRYGGSWQKVAARIASRAKSSSMLPESVRMTITQSGCNQDAPSNTWILREYPYLSMLIDEKQHCCASACIWLLESIAITPTNGLLDPCCDKCNKYNCDPFNATAVAAIEHQTRIEVPALLDEYATVVTVQV